MAGKQGVLKGRNMSSNETREFSLCDYSTTMEMASITGNAGTEMAETYLKLIESGYLQTVDI